MAARFRAVLVASDQAETVGGVVKEDLLVVLDQVLEMAEGDQESESLVGDRFF